MPYYRNLLQASLMLIFSIALQAAAAANQLAGHPSPYLALHGGDPVDWKAWDADVIDNARAGNRLVFVSVGYFSCHWCHVMQQESYQDAEVAKILNQKYISVKVDRELDPDLDRRLIDFVEATRGAAGWPLNVFLTPEGYPVLGFTYLPRNDFARVLRQLDQQWQQDKVALASAARDFFQSRLQDPENQAFDAPQIPAAELVDAFVAQTMLAADELQGGIGNSSKFPNVPQLAALLDAISQNRDLDQDVSDFVNLTLRAMASLNLQDQVNGGFFRYTTDPDWQTPHFEKMLYDNALLARLYLKAHQLWPAQGYASVATRTLDFVEKNLQHPDGGYMASLSAVDKDNKEGGAYYWTRGQLSALLDSEELEYLLGLMPAQAESGEFLITALIGEDVSGNPEKNIALLRKLQSRGSASMPVDDKRLASWNAMMLTALTAAADIDPRFRDRAHSLFQSMRDNFYRAGSLIRFAGNAAVADAVLEDYAEVAAAFLGFGQKFTHQDAIEFARQLTQRAHDKFLKNGRWQAKQRPLIPIAQGQWIIPDRVLNSPMTLWLEVALEVPGLDPELRQSAATMLQRASREMLDSPYFYGSFIMLRARDAS